MIMGITFDINYHKNSTCTIIGRLGSQMVKRAKVPLNQSDRLMQEISEELKRKEPK